MAKKNTDKAIYNEISRVNKPRMFFYGLLGAGVIVFSFFMLKTCSAREQAPTKAPETAVTANPPAEYRGSYNYSDVEIGNGYVDVIINGHTYRVTNGQSVLDFDANGNAKDVTDQDVRNQVLSEVQRLGNNDTNIRIQVGDIELDKQSPAPVTDAAPKQYTDSEITEYLKNLAPTSLNISFKELSDTLNKAGWSERDFMTLLLAGYEPDAAYTILKNQAETKSAKLIKNTPDEKPKEIFSGSEAQDSSSSTEYPSWLSDTDTFLGDSMNAMIANLSNAVSSSSENQDGSTTDALRQAQSSGIYSDMWSVSNAKSAWLTDAQNKTASDGTIGRLTKYELAPGTIVPITILTAINTDNPGQTSAIVRANIYDSLTGTVNLIPKGTRLSGTYNTAVVYGQNVVQVAWTNMITPDGYIYNLPGFQGVGPDGSAGTPVDDANYHIWSMIGGSILGTLIKFGTGYGASKVVEAAVPSYLYSNNNQNGSNLAQNLYKDIVSPVENTTNKIVDYIVNRAPTLIVESGSFSNLFVSQKVNLKRPGI